MVLAEKKSVVLGHRKSILTSGNPYTDAPWDGKIDQHVFS